MSKNEDAVDRGVSLILDVFLAERRFERHVEENYHVLWESVRTGRRDQGQAGDHVLGFEWVEWHLGQP